MAGSVSQQCFSHTVCVLIFYVLFLYLDAMIINVLVVNTFFSGILSFKTPKTVMYFSAWTHRREYCEHPGTFGANLMALCSVNHQFKLHC